MAEFGFVLGLGQVVVGFVGLGLVLGLVLGWVGFGLHLGLAWMLEAFSSCPDAGEEAKGWSMDTRDGSGVAEGESPAQSQSWEWRDTSVSMWWFKIPPEPQTSKQLYFVHLG